MTQSRHAFAYWLVCRRDKAEQKSIKCFRDWLKTELTENTPPDTPIPRL